MSAPINRTRFHCRRGLAIALITICGSSQPAPIMGSSFKWAQFELARFSDTLTSIGNTTAFSNSSKYSPKAPLSRESLEGLVAAISLHPSEETALVVGEHTVFAAIPVDQFGNAVHGLYAKWRSSDSRIVSVSEYGELTTYKLGEAKLIAQVGQKSASVNVDVIPSPISMLAQGRLANKYESPETTRSVKSLRAHYIPLPFVGGDDKASLFYPSNGVGNPPGTTTPGADSPGAASVSSEAPGMANFNFGLPVSSLPGRGITAELNLIYNSRVWNKSKTATNATKMTFDVDKGWPAPGFRLGYGYLEYVTDPDNEFMNVVEPDGTRHKLEIATGDVNGSRYDSYDGTFVNLYIPNGGSPYATFPDGTRVTYGVSGEVSTKYYPTKIADRNGNFILITYAGTNGAGPRILSVQDTLSRYLRFYYATNNDLVTITAPGFNGSPTERQILRFYYQDITVNQSGLFQSGIVISAPTTAHVVQYVYEAGSVESNQAHIGYKYAYSPYGMIYDIKQFRGMTVSSTSQTQTGSVSVEGTQAAVTTYNYPTSTSSLSNVPAYTTRTDDWAGRTSSQPVYSFTDNQTTGVSTVTAPDSTVTETTRNVHAGLWDDGLIVSVKTKIGSTILSQVSYTWERGPDAMGTPANPRWQKVEITNEAGEKQTVTYEYDTTPNYNNVRKMHEYDFALSGLGTELRRTETSYVTSSSYTDRGLFHLPSSVQVYGPVSGTMTLFSQKDLFYDETSLTSYVDITSKMWTDPNTASRGNRTRIRSYPDVSNLSSYIDHTTTFDVAGNPLTTQVDCCQQKSVAYSSSYNYAYVTSVTRGTTPSLTTAVSYDFNTALVAQATDANSQITSYSYNSDSLRLDHVDFPDSGRVSYSYSDGLMADSAGRLHFLVTATTKLDSLRSVSSKTYFNGRGDVTQTFSSNTSTDGWVVDDVEYDVMGRAYRTSNPYYCTSDYGTCSINPSGFWTTNSFDNLGRVTQVTMPRGDDNNSLTTSVQTTYAGSVTTATDQTGKQRRQLTDALGRVVRVDEADNNGSLGTTSLPNQATYFQYDVFNNVVHVTQGSQNRFYKYDSLSRLVRELQPEQTVNSSYNLSDSLTGNSSWTSQFQYNSNGLLTDAYDARGNHSIISYDGLNRVTNVTYSDSTPTSTYYYDSQTLPSGAPSFSRGSSAGRVVAMTYGGSSATTGTYFGYDNMGRVNVQKQVTGANTYSLAYTYNLLGLVESETYPSGRVLNYSYDEAARLSRISDGSTTFANNLTYASNGSLLSETWGNGAVHSLAYNRRFQPIEIKLKQSSSGTELQRYNYSYGQVTLSTGSVDSSKNNGQIGRIDAFINGASTKEWDQRFVYDSIGRLATAGEYQQGGSTQSWQQQFSYDRYGNRFQSGTGNTGVTFVPVLSSDITPSTNRFTTSVTYDSSGNILQDMKFRLDSQGYGMNYTYDANGRQLTAARTNGANPETSVVDCAGLNVKTTANSLTRTHVYDQFGQLVADYYGASRERENVYSGGQLLASEEFYAPTVGIHYFLTDAQGSTRTRISNNGSSSVVESRHDYLPFGEEISSGVGLRTTNQGYGVADPNRRKYGMIDRSDVNGLDHAMFRKYESYAGRWTSPDTFDGSYDLTNPQSLNRYSYSLNDPVNLVDPTGLDPPLCTIDGVSANCSTAANFISAGAGISGPRDAKYDRDKGTFVFPVAIAVAGGTAAGWIPQGYRYIGGLTWAKTDYDKPGAPSYSASLTNIDNLHLFNGQWARLRWENWYNVYGDRIGHLPGGGLETDWNTQLMIGAGLNSLRVLIGAGLKAVVESVIGDEATQSLRLGKGFPTKSGSLGRQQPYDPKTGRYLRFSANPGILHSQAAFFWFGFGEGVVVSKTPGPPDFPPAQNGAQWLGQMLGYAAGSVVGPR